MLCQLWASGTIVDVRPLFVERLINTNWDTLRGFPELTAYGATYNDANGTATRYFANPPWQYGNDIWYTFPNFYYKNCQGLDPNQKYDCLNGQCIPATTYNTPGVFGNLAACQSGCARNSNCTGECVGLPEIAALRQAANNLQTRFCG